MRSYITRLLVVDLLLITQKAHSFQIRDADLNRILDYLREDKYEESNKSNLESKESEPAIPSLSRGLSGVYRTSQYSNDDRESRTLRDITDIEPNLEDLAKILSQKSQPINTRLPTFDREAFVSKYNDGGNNAHDYSKVYLVLDPRAKINNADLKSIGDIVSSLLSGKGKMNKNPKPKKQQRYKGFAVIDDFLARRRIRDSNEKFSKDSIERDYKQKRARNDYSGGSGRTAIPYIGHRADIYERE
ncbi:unnamed protein product [Colias eurytheme]|nr:unnamed protein product [Colias eurytheme]